MMQWSLAAELLAFILVVMIALFYYDRKQIKSAREKIFEIGLFLAEISIILNAVCVYTIENYNMVPYWLNMTLNSGYFLISVWMSVAIAAYLFDLLLEHVYSKLCRRRAVTGLGILTGIYTSVVVLNFWNKWLFWFDRQGGYHRGILNKIGYVILIIELAMVVMCYWRNRESVGRNVKKVVHTLPTIILMFAAFQVAYPEVLLNGTIGAFTLLVIFVNFQSFQIEKDGLTGIGNRKSFYEELRLRLGGKQKIQVVMVSLKNFAMVNQQFGYRKGNEFLYHIARWMEGCWKEGQAFRFGNVTFALLCPYVNEEDSRNLLEKMEEKFRQPWILGDIQCSMSACFGMMTNEESAMEVTDVVELLTFLAELAKRSDDGMVKLDKKTAAMFQKEKKIEKLLQDSVERGRLEVWYQPLFNTRQQKFDAAEALVRMRDDDGNIVSPADFIPLAEKKGMVEKIGWFVFQEVCRFLKENPRIPLQTIAVNISEQQFANPKLCEEMETCMKEAGLSADRIKLEITERVILYDEKSMDKLMKAFASRGFMFCVDDFGVGYSNFSSVIHLPFKCIKFDKSLIDKLPSDSQDRLVVKSMLELFHSIGLKVVAEGVETREQQEIIQSMGADYIQGFYYARPMPETNVICFLNGKQC